MQHEKENEKRQSSPLGLDRLAPLANALQNLLTILVQFDLGDDDLGRVDTDGDALAVGLLTDDTLDVDGPLEAVDAGDLTLAALVGASDDCNLVILADGDRSDLEMFKSNQPLSYHNFPFDHSSRYFH